jgi:hypothetical protein
VSESHGHSPGPYGGFNSDQLEVDMKQQQSMPTPPERNTMKILVTGATGYIGGAAAKHSSSAATRSSALRDRKIPLGGFASPASPLLLATSLTQRA